MHYTITQDCESDYTNVVFVITIMQYNKLTHVSYYQNLYLDSDINIFSVACTRVVHKTQYNMRRQSIKHKTGFLRPGELPKIITNYLGGFVYTIWANFLRTHTRIVLINTPFGRGFTYTYARIIMLVFLTLLLL